MDVVVFPLLEINGDRLIDKRAYAIAHFATIALEGNAHVLLDLGIAHMGIVLLGHIAQRIRRARLDAGEVGAQTARLLACVDKRGARS